MKIEGINHSPLTIQEVEHYLKVIGNYEVDESWVYDPELPIDIQNRWSKALYSFMYRIMCEWKGQRNSDQARAWFPGSIVKVKEDGEIFEGTVEAINFHEPDPPTYDIFRHDQHYVIEVIQSNLLTLEEMDDE